eukprot:m.219368 g.219368  ORF g.219368 m.219368 type:complete len:523 (-) comp15110_c0_seq17:3281-4849(-)
MLMLHLLVLGALTQGCRGCQGHQGLGSNACEFFPQDLSVNVGKLTVPQAVLDEWAVVVNKTASDYSTEDGGFVVSVVFRGQPVLERGYGYANSPSGGAPDPKQSIFRPGSVTKLFTALLALRAYEDGKVNLDAPLSACFANIDPLSSPLLDQASMRAAMSHLGGIPREAPCTEQAACNFTTSEMLWRLRDAVPLWPSFLRPAYSNLGFDLVGQAVAAVYNEAYEKLMTRMVFKPLGMIDSGFEFTPSVLARMANGTATANKDLDQLGWGNPAGGAYSTGHDMSTLLALLTAPKGQIPHFFTFPEATRNMWKSPQYVFPSGNAAFALPFEMTRDANIGAWRIGKSGSVDSFSTQVLLLEHFDIGISVMANDNAMSAGPIADELADALFPLVAKTLRQAEQQLPRPLPPSQFPLDSFVGVYTGDSVAAGGVVTANVTVTDARLQILVAFQGNAFPSYLDYVAPSTVFSGGIRARLTVPPIDGLSCYFRSLLAFDAEELDVGDDSLRFQHMIVGVTLRRQTPKVQ